MSTYKELVNMVLDEVKMLSDDSTFLPEHVMFLLDKYRIFLLKQRYSDIRKQIPVSNYQTLCVDLEPYYPYGKDTLMCDNPMYLRSTKEIPAILPIANLKVSPKDIFNDNISYVAPERFPYAGSSKYAGNTIYATLSTDNYIYLKSNNSRYSNLKKIRVSGVFEDTLSILSAEELLCDKAGDCAIDVMDANFPMEEALIPPIIELVVKELTGAKYTAADDINNAKDDSSDLASYLARHLKKRTTE